MIDIRFPQRVPPINRKLLTGEDHNIVIEVLAHLDSRTIRGISLTPTEGLSRGAVVVDTGQDLVVPVGQRVSGRAFNVFGETIDDGDPVEGGERRPVHQPPVDFSQQAAQTELLETGVKAIDVLVPLERGGKAGLFGGSLGRQDRAHHGDDSQRGREPRRCEHVLRHRRAHPRGRRALPRPSGIRCARKHGAGIRADELARLGVARERQVVLPIGLRVTFPLEQAGVQLDEVFSVPASLSGLCPLVQDVLLQIGRWHDELGVDRFLLYHNQPTSHASYRPHTRHLLPVDVAWLPSLEEQSWGGRTLPMFTVDWPTLFAALIRQHLLVSVYCSIADSLAAGNASRMASMQATERNIDERVEELRNRFHRQRQVSITAELLDIVGGFEALGGHPDCALPNGVGSAARGGSPRPLPR